MVGSMLEDPTKELTTPAREHNGAVRDTSDGQRHYRPVPTD